MAKINEIHFEPWLDRKLAALGPDSTWQPNANRGLALLREKRQAKPWRRRPLVWTVAVTAIVCLFAMALPEPRVLAHRCLDCTIAIWQSLSTPAAIPAAVKPEKDRKMAPDFSLNDASGKPVTLSDFKGNVVLINFWATWCHGCGTEIPWFIELADKYRRNGLTVVGISTDDDGWVSVKPYAASNKMNYPVVISTKEVIQNYAVTALPVTLMIDRDGRIAVSHDGVISKDTYEAEINILLAERASAKQNADRR